MIKTAPVRIGKCSRPECSEDAVTYRLGKPVCRSCVDNQTDQMEGHILLLEKKLDGQRTSHK